ncbi:hypothetical protein V2647_03790 [Tenacibaculum maritimum]|uniref:hypothetical protein n=2 Tax=Tenacibaculum maritimum TaxID=107401 RepID=UPI001330F6DD|nr:hypothetical protein [Tenacibaculum maritimum]
MKKIKQTQGITQILKTNKQTIFFLFLSILLVLTYFSSELVSEYNDYYYAAKFKYQRKLDTLKIYHKKVIELAEKNEIIKAYKAKYIEKNKAKKKFKEAKEDAKVFGFNDYWHFSYIVGRAFYKFILIGFLLIYFLSKNRKNKGMLMMLFTCFSLTLFEIYWAFQPFKDVSKFSYYIISLNTTIFLTYSFIFFKKNVKSKYDKLKEENRKLENVRERLLIQTILHSPEEKKKEILDFIESTY